MRLVLLASALATLPVTVAACTCAAPHVREPDASAVPDVPPARDAPRPRDTPIAPDAPPPPPGSLGAACDAGACLEGLVCGSDVVVTILELDGETRTEVIAAGLCTHRCALDEESSCGEGASCIASVPFGAGRVSVLDAAGDGLCFRVGYGEASYWRELNPHDGRPAPPPCPPGTAGDVVQPGCVPACRTDADCFYEPVSVRPPVFAEIAPTRAIDCDVYEGICRHFSSTGPVLGSPCTSNLDCQFEHRCWGGPDWATPGVCVVPDCEHCAGPERDCVRLEPGAQGCVSATP